MNLYIERGETLLQKPVSRPTANKLASWLKETDKATGLLELSIAGRVFMAEVLPSDMR